MSIEYDRYLERHRANVSRGFSWIASNLPELIPNDGTNYEWQFLLHDKSKADPEEYDAYDRYFYGRNRSYAVVQDFRRAWLRHIHCNPHHWQYWVLINDDPDEGEVCIEMPGNYILEMVCDWWSFSWDKGKPEEIFDWYDEHRDYMKLHDKTRQRVEDILDRIGEKLSEGSSELMHYGVKGMKWGVRNGPPYPIDHDKELDSSEKRSKMKIGLQFFAKIPEAKLVKYALDYEKAPDKAKAFELALGYTKQNYQELISNINDHLDKSKLVEKGDSGYGMRYEYIMRLKGPNGKEANVLTAWIDDEDDIRLTSVYVTKKEVTK